MILYNTYTRGSVIEGLALLPVAFADVIGVQNLGTGFGMSCVPSLAISLVGPSAGGKPLPMIINFKEVKCIRIA